MSTIDTPNQASDLTQDTSAQHNIESHTQAMTTDASAESSTPPGSATAQNTLHQQLVAAEAKAQEHYEQLLRSTAEMANLRKRHATEIESAHKYALEKFANELLGTKDSLEAAIDMLTKNPDDLTVLKEGVELTLRQLTQSFEKFKIIELNPMGQPFDPNQHQAISMAPNPDIPNNHVIQVLQKGYLIAERVLRPALVIVSQG